MTCLAWDLLRGERKGGSTVIKGGLDTLDETMHRFVSVASHFYSVDAIYKEISQTGLWQNGDNFSPHHGNAAKFSGNMQTGPLGPIFWFWAKCRWGPYGIGLYLFTELKTLLRDMTSRKWDVSAYFRTRGKSLREIRNLVYLRQKSLWKRRNLVRQTLKWFTPRYRTFVWKNDPKYSLFVSECLEKVLFFNKSTKWANCWPVSRYG